MSNSTGSMMFGLGPSVREAYEGAFERYGEANVAVIGSFAVQVIASLVFALPSFIYPLFRSLDHLKLQPKRVYSAKDQLYCIASVVLSHGLIYLPLIYFLYHFTGFVKGWEKDFDKIDPWTVTVLKLAFCMVCEDTWHYWAHRALHTKQLYWIHKLHHKYTAPFALAAEFAHPIETVVLGTGFFVGIVFVCNHIAFFWIWDIVRLWQTMDVHSGYDIPLFPINWIPSVGIRAQMHDWHHAKFNSCYASTFTFWDWAMGTDQDYRAHVESAKTSTKAKKVE